MMSKEAVVLVHGIWMKGIEFAYLSYQLRKAGYQTYYFRYKSLFSTPAENATRLNKFLATLNEPVIHLVCHSLGGIVAFHLFNEFKQEKPGKLILLGTPIKGSAVAKSISQRTWLKWLLGKSTNQGLIGDMPTWDSKRDVYMIAGTRALGIGIFLAPDAIEKLCDGSVNLDETVAPYLKEHIVVPHSHFTMLWSKQVSNQVINFLHDK